MKLLRLLLVIGLLCKTIDAKKTEEDENNVSFSVGKIWQSYCTTEEDESIREAVKEFYYRCRATATSFRGKALTMADSTLNTLEKLITKLFDLSNSNNTIVASSCAAMLESMSKFNKLGGSGLNVIVEYEKVFPTASDNLNVIAGSLSEHIGKERTCSFTRANSDLGTALTNYMREFISSSQSLDCKKRVDYTCVLQKYQNFTNIVAQIDDTLLNKCENEVPEDVLHSVVVLHLLCIFMTTAVTGVNSCAMDALNKRNCHVSESAKSCALPFKDALVEVVQAVSALDASSADSIKNFRKVILSVVARLGNVLNSV